MDFEGLVNITWLEDTENKFLEKNLKKKRTLSWFDKLEYLDIFINTNIDYNKKKIKYKQNYVKWLNEEIINYDKLKHDEKEKMDNNRDGKGIIKKRNRRRLTTGGKDIK